MTTRLKLKLNTTNQSSLSVFYNKILGVGIHEGVDVQTQVTAYIVEFKNIPHFLQIVHDYANFQANEYPSEKLPEIISIDLLGVHSVDSLNRLFKTPEVISDQINELQEKVRILSDRLDAAKTMFFDYQQFHRLPEVLHSICVAIKRTDILEDFTVNLVQDEVQKSLQRKH